MFVWPTSFTFCNKFFARNLIERVNILEKYKFFAKSIFITRAAEMANGQSD